MRSSSSWRWIVEEEGGGWQEKSWLKFGVVTGGKLEVGRKKGGVELGNLSGGFLRGAWDGLDGGGI